MAGSQSNANANRLLSVCEVAAMFGVAESQVRERMTDIVPGQEYLSMREVATRWRCSRGTVYNRLRAVGAKVLDFAPRGKKGKKVVPVRVVVQIEEGKLKRLF
jgi:predicted DNA-binding transcriptional regulator AlpA